MKETNFEHAQKLANSKTQEKESNKNPTSKDSKFINTFNNNNIEIEYNKIPKEKLIFNNKLNPEGPNEEQINQWKKYLAIDEENHPDEWKLSSIKIWDDYFIKYKKICNILNIKSMEFNKNNIFDKYKDKLSEILAEDSANSHMDILTYGTKRIMVEIMSKINDSKLNCIIFFLFQCMLDVILLREELLMMASGNNINNIIFEDFVFKLKELDIIKENINTNNKENIPLQEKLTELEQKLRKYELNNNQIGKTLFENNTKINEFIKNNDINNKNWLNFINNITTRLKNCEEHKYKNNNPNLNKIYGLIRKLNARCSGLHDKIINLEDKLTNLEEDYNNDIFNKIETKIDKNKNNSISDEWEEIEEEEDENEFDESNDENYDATSDDLEIN